MNTDGNGKRRDPTAIAVGQWAKGGGEAGVRKGGGICWCDGLLSPDIGFLRAAARHLREAGVGPELTQSPGCAFCVQVNCFRVIRAGSPG